LWEREREEGKGLYVKDWHLIAELENRGGGVGEVYEVPECFRGGSELIHTRQADHHLPRTVDLR